MNFNPFCPSGQAMKIYQVFIRCTALAGSRPYTSDRLYIAVRELGRLEVVVGRAGIVGPAGTKEEGHPNNCP